MGDKTRRAAATWDEQWEVVATVVTKVRKAGPEMLRLALELRSLPDGYPARSISDGSSPSADSDTSTERAALHTYPDDDPDEDRLHPGPDDRLLRVDRVDLWLGEFFASEAAVRANLDKMDRLVNLISRRRDVRVGERAAGAGPCRACLRDVVGSSEDRLRSGFCYSCYKAWRASRDRAADEDGHPVEWFIAERRLALRIDDEGKELQGHEREEAERAVAEGVTGRQLVARQREREVAPAG